MTELNSIFIARAASTHARTVELLLSDALSFAAHSWDRTWFASSPPACRMTTVVHRRASCRSAKPSRAKPVQHTKLRAQ